MIGPGKNPEARGAAIRAMSKSHAGLMQAIGVEPKPEEKKSPISAQRDKPKLSLTKEESNMSQEDIVEKLQAALDAGILSQNDFDKLTQTEEVEPIDELSTKTLKSYINKNIKSGRAKDEGKGDDGLFRATDKVAQRLTTPTLDKKVRNLGDTPFLNIRIQKNMMYLVLN